MGPRVGGYVPQGLTTLTIIVVTFFSLSIPTFFHLFILFCNCYLLAEFIGSDLCLMNLCCFQKNLSQEAMLLNTYTYTYTHAHTYTDTSFHFLIYGPKNNRIPDSLMSLILAVGLLLFKFFCKKTTPCIWNDSFLSFDIYIYIYIYI